MIIFDPFGSIYDDNLTQEDEELDDADDLIQTPNATIISAEEDNEEDSVAITLDTLYSPTFDMQATIASITNIAKCVKNVISEVESIKTSPSLGDTEAFESVCMDVIDRIVRMNKKWTRQDAIQESAKELVAVRKASQSLMVETVHMRVLREFLIASDDEYTLLRNQLWA